MNRLSGKMLIAAAILVLGPTIACADDGAAVATGRGEELLPSLEAADPLPMERSYDEEAVPPPFDRRPHGEIEAAVGTGGYREVAGTVVVPIGDKGYVAAGVVMVDQGSRGRRVLRTDEAYGGGRPPTSP